MWRCKKCSVTAAGQNPNDGASKAPELDDLLFLQQGVGFRTIDFKAASHWNCWNGQLYTIVVSCAVFMVVHVSVSYEYHLLSVFELHTPRTHSWHRDKDQTAISEKLSSSWTLKKMIATKMFGSSYCIPQSAREQTLYMSDLWIYILATNLYKALAGERTSNPLCIAA